MTTIEAFKVHGIDFERTGDCTQCGGCDAECSTCPHGELKGKKWYCSIYDPDTRGKVCDYCTNNPDSSWYRNGDPVTHQVCIDFPDHPWIGVVRSGECAYKFTRKDTQSMDTVPFVDGKFIKS